ncbi:hypothetical protein DPMN_133879 [Dreissena polymorpha]|uniref:Uncharacterized protein n=1 Tax=Dreissena polymorpha TaxID=45954 RepID=A0A9D4FZ43_DREPO|nr:hypothetical protein DPMN_182908 [Dreissena polymorpha]KAH3805575.1 hypothetical protein DPMN_133879 [Dreissena polymorpha]
MKQLAVATLQMGTWEDIEETYTLSDKMLEFTGDLSTPQGRERYCYHVEKLSVNDKDAWTVTITVKKNGIDVPLQPQILQKFTEKIIKTVQKNVTDFEE